MSRDGIEVQIEAITREERDAERRVGSAAGSEEQGAPYVGCADEDESTGRIARARIDGQPQPEHLGGVAQSGSQQWSSCRCGRCRLRKQRSWKSSACLPARVSHLV